MVLTVVLQSTNCECAVEFHSDLNGYGYEAAIFKALNVGVGRGCARSVRVGAHGLLKLIQSSGVVGADDGSGEILIGWNLMRVEENAIVLLRF